MPIEDVVRTGDIVELCAQVDNKHSTYEIIRAVKERGWGFDRKGPLYTIGENQISNESPLGKALLGHRVDDLVLGYRIVKIVRGANHINHQDDIKTLELTAKDASMRQLYKDITLMKWLKATVLSYENRLYPIKESRTTVQPVYTLFNQEYMTDVSISNVGFKSTDLVHIHLRLSSPYTTTPNTAKAHANMIVKAYTIDALGLKPCPIGKRYVYNPTYSTLDSEAELAFQPPALEARIDPYTKQLVCRRVPGRLEHYYLCIE